jgi:energy-coupling factor transport system permease protein
MIPILVPLFVSAFRIAQDMALAMEARCYHGGEGRTRMNKIKFGAGDAVMGLLMIGFIAVVVLERVYL